MGTFGDAERKIAQLMSEGTKFILDDNEYTVMLSGKPTCAKGEPKTDIYILAESNKNEIRLDW